VALAAALSMAVLTTCVAVPAAGAHPLPAPRSSVERNTTVVAGVTCTFTDAATATRLRAAIRARRTVGTAISVHDLRTDTSCGYRDRELFVTASVVKASTVAALMWKRRQQGRALSTREKAWANAAIRRSDNPAQSALWSALGRGPEYLRFARRIGMTATRTDPRGRWGLTRTTTRDQVRFLDELATGSVLAPADRAYLLGLMRSVIPSQRWGVATRALSRTRVAVKNGWLRYGGSWRVNSIGYVSGGTTSSRHSYTVAVLSSGSATMSTGVRRVSTAARAAHDVL